MKKILVAVLLIVGAFGFYRVYVMKTAIAARYPLSELKAIAIEANKNLPVMVDQLTRLDSVVAHEGILEKRYSLVSTKLSDVNVGEFTAKISPILISESCRNKLSLNLYASGISESFTYSDMEGQKISTITINKKSCS